MLEVTGELGEVSRANTLLTAFMLDSEFCHRLLADDAAAAGKVMISWTVWRICRDSQWWSVFGRKRGENGKLPGLPVHDDLLQRDFTAVDVNEV